MMTTLMDDDVDDEDVDFVSLTRKRRKAAGKAKQKAAAVERSEACLCLPARGIAAIGGRAHTHAHVRAGTRARLSLTTSL